MSGSPAGPAAVGPRARGSGTEAAGRLVALGARGISLVVVLLLGACADGPPEPLPLEESSWRDSVEAWHARRVAELEAPDSWLGLVGLHWLEEGSYTVGSSPRSDIVLPRRAAARVGTLFVDDDSVHFEAAPGVVVTRGIDSTLALPAGTGARPPELTELPRVEHAVLSEEVGDGKSVVLRHGSLNWIIHPFGDRRALRIRDNADETYRHFADRGLERYPVDPAWRVTARWVPHEKTVAVPNIIGTVGRSSSPAHLEFWVDGERHTLDVTGEPGQDRYMLVFADATSGSGTYGGGRYLWIDAPDASGRVAVDFNLAYNPPCVFSPYATCPLPSRDNRLTVPVTAGERSWAYEGASSAASRDTADSPPEA